MPCPHHDIKIVQRSNRQSAVAAAAYQSGERLFSEYDQKQKYYAEKRGIVHTEIMLPPHAPPEYADRNTLWNAAEAVEKQWNSQLARRIVLAIPREIPPEQHADLIRDYCREFFVSKGMIADFAIHDKGDGNPHAHILLTMRAMDENGKWLPKSRKVYDLDENGERIRLPSGNWKSHKEDTVDWNDQKYGEIWRQGWAAVANRYLEANDRPERLDLRSYERQGLDKIPTVHMGPAVSQMEKRGIQTNIGNLNRDITPTERRYLLRVPLILDAKKDCSRHALQSPDFSYCEVNPLLFRLPLSPLLLRLQSVCLYRSYRPAARQAAAARWISPHCCSGRKIDLPKYDTGLQGHRIPVNSAVVPCSRYSQGSAGKYITRRLPFCGSRRIHFSRLL